MVLLKAQWLSSDYLRHRVFNPVRRQMVMPPGFPIYTGISSESSIFVRQLISMKHKILKKQQISKMCFVCGVKNDFGLHANFYETDVN